MFRLFLINAKTGEWFSTVEIGGIYGFTGNAVKRIRDTISQQENHWEVPFSWILHFNDENVTETFLELEKQYFGQ